MAVHDLIKKNFTEHQRIVFNGNGYSDEWVEEAKRRGLPYIGCMVDAVEALTSEQTIELFEKFGVFTKAELFRQIWDMESVGDIATVTVHIKKIREKIEFNTAKPQYIETIWGVGYRFKV